MTKLTPKIQMRNMMKKNKMENASTVKLFEDIKLKFEKDDSGSESDFEDDDEEIPELVNIPPKKQGAAKTPVKKQTPMKLERKTPQRLAKTPAGKTPIKQQTPMNLERKTPKNLAKTQAKTPIKSNTPKMAKKPVPEDEQDDDSEDIEMEDEDGDLEIPEKLTKPIAKTSIKGSAKKEDEDVVVKTKGAERSAPDVCESWPKMIKMVVDENDELMQAQYERIARTEREKLANGIDRLRLHMMGLKGTTIDEVKAAFPKSTNIDMKKSNAFLSFSSPADVDEAFQSAEDLTINERKAHVVYAQADENAEFDEVLLEAQYERKCQIERDRLTYGVNKLRLIVKGLPKFTTDAELMGAFEGSKVATINSRNDDEGFVKFVTEKDARLAFDGSVDKFIKKKKVVVLYSPWSFFDNCRSNGYVKKVEASEQEIGDGENGGKTSSDGEVKNQKKRKRSRGKKDKAAEQENGGGKAATSSDGEKIVEVKNQKKHDSEDIEMEDEDDDLEIPAKPIAKTPIKGSAKKDKKPAVSAKKTKQVSEEEDEDVVIKTKGTKRSAPDVGERSPKKIKMVVDENDELIKAQYERIARAEREKLANGIDRLKLRIVGLKRRTTIDEVKAAFPKSLNVDIKLSNIYVSFASTADADEAFAEDLTINERKANIVYALADKKGDFDEELIEAQYERSCQIERSRLTYGVNKSELIVKGLPKGTTVAELMEAFDGSKRANINSDTDDGFVCFETEEDARLAFDRSFDKFIKSKKVVVLYSGLSEFGKRDTKRRRRKRVTKVVGKGGEKASSNGEKSEGVKNGKKSKRSRGKKVNAAKQENGGGKASTSSGGKKKVKVKNGKVGLRKPSLFIPRHHVYKDFCLPVKEF